MKNPFENEFTHEPETSSVDLTFKHEAIKYLARYCYEYNRRAYEELGLQDSSFSEYGTDSENIKLILRQLIPDIVNEVINLQK